MLEHLSNYVLLEAYDKACRNNLEEDFIAILEAELHGRDLHQISKSHLNDMYFIHKYVNNPL